MQGRRILTYYESHFNKKYPTFKLEEFTDLKKLGVLFLDKLIFKLQTVTACLGSEVIAYFPCEHRSEVRLHKNIKELKPESYYKYDI